MTTTAELTNVFASVLRCQPKFVSTRLIGLGHEVVCGRCGGCGEYSYCQAHGTRCFGCGGSGKKAPKLTKTLLNKVTEQALNGELDAYIDALRAKQAAKAYAKQAQARFLEAWGSNPANVADEGKHWTKCSKMSAAVNCICSPLFEVVCSLVNEFSNGDLWLKASHWHKENGYTIKNGKARHQFDDGARVILNKWIEQSISLASQAQQVIEGQGITEESFGEYAHQHEDLQKLVKTVVAPLVELIPAELAAAGYGEKK